MPVINAVLTRATAIDFMIMLISSIEPTQLSRWCLVPGTKRMDRVFLFFISRSKHLAASNGSFDRASASETKRVTHLTRYRYGSVEP
jgi:hypothetical protein